MRPVDKRMNLLGWDNLKALLADHGWPRLSILMPVNPAEFSRRQGPIRLKGMLQQAERQLSALGLEPAEADNLLAPAYALMDNRLFWRHQSQGLALFLAPNSFSSYRLPVRFDKEVIVGSQFYIKPLLPAVTGDDRFFILALSQKRIRLVEATQFTVAEVELEELATSLEEALQYHEFERSLQFHTGTGQAASGTKRSALYHGHGAAGDNRTLKKNILHFFQKVDNGIRRHLAQPGAPLVLAGVEYIRGLYREANHYPKLTEQDIDESPDSLRAEDLQRLAWPLVEPIFLQRQREAAARYRQLAAKEPGCTSTQLEQVVPAAYYRRVDTLFVPRHEHRWGIFTAEEGQVTLHTRKQAGDEELLNLATAYTLQGGGTVYSVEREEMPEQSPVAAILR